MYAVVASAKALYDRLGLMGESAIDGDTFLDLWVYVILKANVKDLVSFCTTSRISYKYIYWVFFTSQNLHKLAKGAVQKKFS